MGVSCFSQSSYPRKIVLGTDTIVALQPAQVTTINKAINERRYYKAMCELQAKDITDLKNIRSSMDTIVANKDSIIYLERQKLVEADRYNEKIKVSLQKKHYKRVLQVGVGGFIVGLITGIIITK